MVRKVYDNMRKGQKEWVAHMVMECNLTGREGIKVFKLITAVDKHKSDVSREV